jgi:hypothetical protein
MLYRRFIKDFSKITKSLYQLLHHDVPFNFTEDCVKAFETLKTALVTTPVIIAPDWSKPFELGLRLFPDNISNLVMTG